MQIIKIGLLRLRICGRGFRMIIRDLVMIRSNLIHVLLQTLWEIECKWKEKGSTMRKSKNKMTYKFEQ
jgi:hypothetical protein